MCALKQTPEMEVRLLPRSPFRRIEPTNPCALMTRAPPATLRSVATTFDQDERHRQQVAEDRNRDQALARKELNLQRVMETHSGRALIWELLNDPWPLDEVRHRSATDTYHEEGRRDVTRKLYTRVFDNHRDLFMQMVKEAEAEEQQL